MNIGLDYKINPKKLIISINADFAGSEKINKTNFEEEEKTHSIENYKTAKFYSMNIKYKF